MHLVFVVNTDFFFLSHRLSLAKAAQERGWDVTLIAPPTGRAEDVRREGINFIPLPLSRSGMNPFEDLRTLWFLWRTYRRLRPDVVHHVTSKPVIYGSIAARLVPGTRVVNAISGLGYVFIQKGQWHPVLLLMKRLYRAALRPRGNVAIFQNEDDRSGFRKRRLVRQEQTTLIRGCGVDTEVFAAAEEPPGPPVILFPARLLKDKGVVEFVEAARLLKQRDAPEARFVLVGRIDEGNRAGVPAARVEQWQEEGVVEWWGYQDDMPATLARSHVVALPSYREGLPKVLLEAAATARALVTTDVPGCREVVEYERNGLLVPARDARALADALQRLLEDPDLRQRLARESRQRAEGEFSQERFVRESMRVYDWVLGIRGRQTQEPSYREARVSA